MGALGSKQKKTSTKSMSQMTKKSSIIASPKKKKSKSGSQKTDKNRQLKFVNYAKTMISDPWNRFVKIDDTLYLSGIGGMTAKNIRVHKIQCIVNATIELPSYKKEGIENVEISVWDSPQTNLSLCFDEVSKIIHEMSQKKMPTVVHCIGGISRSATLVMAYLMKYKGMTFKKAVEYVREKRPMIRPNGAFLKQLLDYEMKIFGTNSLVCVEKDGKVESIPGVFGKERPKECVIEENFKLEKNDTSGYLRTLLSIE